MTDHPATDLRDSLNMALHRMMTDAEPCRSACTHRVWGEWTALGIANVLSRSGAKSDRIRELEAKVARLEARGIEDMQHRIRELEAAIRLPDRATDDDDWEDQPNPDGTTTRIRKARPTTDAPCPTCDANGYAVWCSDPAHGRPTLKETV